MSVLEPFQQDLDRLSQRARRRGLAAAAGLDFASNDYLGLAASGRLSQAAQAALARGVPVGASGSRLLRGNHPEHEALEAEAAAHFGAGGALYFGSGYTANLALISTLPQRDDLIVYDALSHASTRDGLKLARAQHRPYRHNDLDHLQDEIADWRRGGGRGAVWIAAESVYSMEGDCAPVAGLMALADRHDGFLILDEAHATGVFGPNGRGLGAPFEGRPNLISLHTCGKALGASGALVTADKVLIDFLVNRARSFIFATAPSPLTAAVVRAALDLLRTDPQRQSDLHTRVAHGQAQLHRRLGVAPSGSQILPVILGEDARALAAAQALQAQGFDVRAIRPPTVPEGAARLRLSVTLNVGQDDIDALIDALVPLMEFA